MNIEPTNLFKALKDQRSASPIPAQTRKVAVPVCKKVGGHPRPLRAGEIRAREWDASVRDLAHGKGGYSRNRPIIAFENKTGDVSRYKSIREAAQSLFSCGRTASATTAQIFISLVCNGHRRTALGYVWRYDWERYGVSATGRFTRVSEWEKGIKRIRYRKQQMLALTGRRPVIAFEVNGERMLRFASLHEAGAECVRWGKAKALKAAVSSVSQSISGKYKSSFGFVWRYNWEAIPLPVKKCRLKPVVGTPVKGGAPERFDSATSAAHSLLARGLTRNFAGARQRISQVCHKDRATAFGYRWDFAPAT